MHLLLRAGSGEVFLADAFAADANPVWNQTLVLKKAFLAADLREVRNSVRLRIVLSAFNVCDTMNVC